MTLVAKTFGVTPSAISMISSCRINPRRYRKVAAEFNALGPEAFGEKYTSQDILDRLARARANRPSPTDRRRGLRQGRGANPEANSHKGKYRDHSGLEIWINWPHDAEIHGWCVYVPSTGTLTGRDWNEDTENPIPFLTSKQAYESICHPGYPLPTLIPPEPKKVVDIGSE